MSARHRRLVILLATLLSGVLHADDWRVFTDLEGRTVEARVLFVGDGEARVSLRQSGREAWLKFDSLCEEDRDYLDAWSPGQPTAEERDQSLGAASDRLYPRTREEIRAKVREIERRPPANGVSRKQQKVINELNVYRYLCGVPDEVEATPELAARCGEAAKACEEHGSLSHDLGRYTNKCNLSMGRGMFGSVAGYMNDQGANNRERRGHRRWCLNPPMTRSGFGESGRFSAMWAMDSGGQRLRDSWGYPGKGFFPKERLHGNGWSLYLTERAPDAKKLTVEVYKLGKRPEKPLSATGEVNGRPLPVEYVSTYLNAINFEPESGTVGRGIYWVRIRGGGVRESYLVELF